LSLCLYERSDLILAEETLRESVEVALSVQGLESYALASYERLEIWLREWGRLEEADEVRALHSTLLDERYPEDDILGSSEKGYRMLDDNRGYRLHLGSGPDSVPPGHLLELRTWQGDTDGQGP
jgi:hypothetical protein